MSQPIRAQTMTFILRIWAEYLKQSPPLLRGEIEHVESLEKGYFSDPEQLVEFIQRCTRSQEKPAVD